MQRNRSSQLTSLTKHLAATLGLAVAAAIIPQSANAASATWIGSADALWSTGGNWDLGSAPDAGNTATFNGAGNGNTTVSLGGGVTLGALRFDTSNAAAYTIGSGLAGTQTLTLDTAGSAITMNSTVAANELINANLGLAVTTTVTDPSTYYAVTNNSLTSSLTIAGEISASTAGVKVLNVAGSGNTTVSGAITSGAGNMSIFKTGSGTLTLSGGGTFSGTGVRDGVNFDSSAVFRQGTTILTGGTYSNSGGELVVGGVATSGGVGTNTTLQLDSATLNNINWLSIGRGNGNGSVTSNLTLNGSSSISAQNMSAGYNAGDVNNVPKGTITLNGSSSLNLTSNFQLGESAGSDFTMTLNDTSSVSVGAGTIYVGRQNGKGTLNVNSGSTFTTNGELRVATSEANGTFNGTGTINVNGGTLNTRGLTLARNNNDATSMLNATVNVNSGTVNVTDQSTLVGWRGNGSNATLNISGGTFNQGTIATTNMTIGSFSGANGAVNVSGGALNFDRNSNLRFSDTTNGNATRTLTIGGGNVTFYSDAGGTVGGTGVIDLMNTSNPSGNNTINLNGGTLTANQIKATSATGTRVVNFNGGTLRSGDSGLASAFLASGVATTANVRNGGAIIDSNGNNVSIGQVLAHSNIGGDAATDGGLTKAGAGTLTLNGVNTYTGPTNVTGGTFTLGSTGSINKSSGIVINGSGAKFLQTNSTAPTPAITVTQGTLDGTGAVGAVTVASNASNVIANGNGTTAQLTLSSLTFNGLGTLSLRVPGGASTSTPALSVTNGVTTSGGAGSVLVDVMTNTDLTIGTAYNLVGYGTTFTGNTANLVYGGNGVRINGVFSNDTVNKRITLTLNGDRAYWTGNQSGAWTTAAVGGAQNWKLQVAGTGTEFLASDDALFDDNATGTTSVNIENANVSVATLHFNNNTKDYTVSSTGGYGITGRVVKTGTGSVTLAANAMGASSVTVSAGVLKLASSNNSYTGATTINGGTLQVGNGGATGSIPVASAITNNGTLAFNRSNTVTQGTDFGTISGTGTFKQAGTGTVVINTTAAYSGPTVISSGTLQVGAGSTGSILKSSAIQNAGALVFNTDTTSSYGQAGSPFYNAPISGTGSLAVNAGAVYLSNYSNSYSGGTTIAPGATLLVGGTLGTTGNDTVTNVNSALGTGTVKNNGTLVLGNVWSAADGDHRTTYTTANAMNLNAGSALYAFDAWQHVTGNVNVAGASILGSTFNGAGADTDRGLSLDGAVSGSADLTIQHSRLATGGNYITSFVTFSGTANTYSGTVTVNENTATNEGGVYLGINSTNALANATVSIPTNIPGSSRKFGASPIVFKSGIGSATFGALTGAADLVLTGYNETSHSYAGDAIALTVGGNGTDTTYSGATSGAGTLVKVGAGTLTLDGGGSSTAGLAINGGRVALASGGALGVSGTISFGGGVLEHSVLNTNDYSGRFSSAPNQAYNVDTNGQDISWAAGLASSGGSLTKSGDGTLTLTGISTYTGNTYVNGGGLTLADNAGLKFIIGQNGVNNRMLGTGALLLDGDFTFDLAGASTHPGDSWTIVDVIDLGSFFSDSFTVTGFTDNQDNTWSFGNYKFDETTGILLVVPEPSSGAILLGGIGMLGLLRRRRA